MAHSPCIFKTLAEIRRVPLPKPFGSLLAVDTTERPRHRREPLCVDRRFAVNAGSKAAVVNSSQRCFHIPQQVGATIHVPNRQVSLVSMLNLVHVVRAFLDGDAISRSYYLNELGLLLFECLLEPTYRCGCCGHHFRFRVHDRPSVVAREGPRQNLDAPISAVEPIVPFVQTDRNRDANAAHINRWMGLHDAVAGLSRESASCRR
jgi:hypothetical protein